MLPRDVTLVVCEGSETEPNYIRDARDVLRLTSTAIELVGVGAAPSSVVDEAIRRFEQSPHYDRVYCVFDRDEHTTYSASIDRCIATRKRNENGKLVQFRHVTSWPCFEYWLLLHFTRSNAPIGPAGGKTAAQVACGQLRKFLPGYAKSSGGALEGTQHLISQASNDAHRYFSHVEENPHTLVYRMMSFFASISSRHDIPWRNDLAALAKRCGEVE